MGEVSIGIRQNVQETADLAQILGNNLRSLRELENITQKDLANLCNMSWRTISNIERGKVIPDLRVITSLSKFFRVSIDELVGIHADVAKSQPRKQKESFIISYIKTCNDNSLNFIKEQINIISNTLKM